MASYVEFMVRGNDTRVSVERRDERIARGGGLMYVGQAIRGREAGVGGSNPLTPAIHFKRLAQTLGRRSMFGVLASEDLDGRFERKAAADDAQPVLGQQKSQI